MNVRIKEGYFLRKIMGDWVVIPYSNTGQSADVIMTLSNTASFLWGLMADEISVESLVALSIEKYDVDDTRAKAGIEKFLDLLRAKGLLVEC